MSGELTQEEKDKAAKLEAEAGKEKSEMEKIGDQLTDVQDLLKSHVETKEEEIPEIDPADEPIDFDNLDPEELAKSFNDDQEKAKEFIVKFTEACGLNPQDMVNTEGVPYIDDEMMKSLEDAVTEGEKYLAGILYAMQETNNRNSVKDSVILRTLSTLTKSVTDIHSVVSELQKSIVKEDPEIDSDADPKEGKESELPPLDAGEPLSAVSTDAGMSKSYNKEALMLALKKSFPGKHGNTIEQEKYNKYAEVAGKLPVKTVLGMMEHNERSLVESYLLPS